MYDRTGNILIIAILIGMIFGVVSVALFGTAILPVKFLGDIFLNALKMVVIPLLFCSMVVGITNLGDIRKLGRTGLKTVLYFLITSSAAVAIGIILVNIFQPGVGVSTFGAAGVDAEVSYSFFEWLTAQIPSNIISAAAETQVLPIIIFALIFGGVLTTLGPKGKPVIAVFDGINEAIMKIVHLIMWFAPIGIFGLIAGQLAAEGGIGRFSELVMALGKYSLVVLLGLLLHAIIVLPAILKFFGGKNPIEYLIGMSQALMTAFATASSSATLPVSMDCVENKNDIDKRASSFVLPLGATINMDGTALYEAVAAIFIAQAYGIDLNIFQQITIFATAILASVGAAGIPQAGLVTMVLVLQAVGLPLEGIGLILAIDWFLDRCRTTVNVWGDSIGAAVIASTAEIALVDRRPKKAKPDSHKRSFNSRREDRKVKPRKNEKTREQPQFSKKGGFVKRFMKRDERDKGGRTKNGKIEPKKQPLVLEDRSTVGRFKMSEAREEYRPEQHREKPKTESKPTGREAASKPAPAAESQKAAVHHHEKPSRQKPAFGRRRGSNRPFRSRRDGDSKDAGAGRPESGRQRDEGVPSKDAPDFNVPKFPDKILEELTAGKMEREKSNPGTAEAAGPKDETSMDFKKVDTPAGEKEEYQDIEDSGKDFSTLDKMVMGDEPDSDSEKPEPLETGQADDTEAHEEVIPRSSQLPEEADHPDRTQSSPVPDTDSAEGIDEAEVDSSDKVEEKSVLERKEVAGAPVEDEEEAEPEGESLEENFEVTEKSEDTGEDDDGGRMKYGRSKHRRPHR